MDISYLLSENTDTIKQLQTYGLDNSEAQVYIFLSIEGSASALQISRGTKISRTRVYKILEDLKTKGFVDEVLNYPGSKFKVSPEQNIKDLINKKELELEQLKKSAPELLTKLNSLQLQNAENSRVVYHKGKEGLKQITWNSLKAKEELRIFEIASNMEAFTDDSFAEKVRHEFYMRNIVTKQLTNYKTISAFTEVENYIKHSMQLRYVDPEKLKLDFELLIYNNVVAIYTYKQNEFFGIEVYSQDLANMQSQIFDFVWEHAQKMQIGKGGSAKVVLSS